MYNIHIYTWFCTKRLLNINSWFYCVVKWWCQNRCHRLHLQCQYLFYLLNVNIFYSKFHLIFEKIRRNGIKFIWTKAFIDRWMISAYKISFDFFFHRKLILYNFLRNYKCFFKKKQLYIKKRINIGIQEFIVRYHILI